MSVDQRGAEPGEEIRILDLVAVVLRRWRIVAVTTVGVLGLALGLALLRPKEYTARIVMLAPQEQGAGRTNALVQQLAGTGLPGLATGSSSGQRLIGVLAASRSFADSMVARVAGPRVNGTVPGAIYKMLGADTEVQPKPDGSVTVDVSGADPQLAAKVANTFPALLNDMSARVGVEAAVQKQRFLESQLNRAREALERSEQRLVAFQKQRNAPELQDQAQRTVDAAADLQRQITAQELEVGRLSRSSAPGNPEYRAAQATLGALRGQLRRLTAGSDNPLFVPFRESPELQATLTRLKRDYARDEQVYTSLTAAMAQAQIDVNNDMPVLSVLDEAVVPGAPTGVSLKLILAAAGMLGLVLGVIAAFVKEHFARARQDTEGGSFFLAWEQFKSDFRLGGSRRVGRTRTPVGG